MKEKLLSPAISAFTDEQIRSSEVVVDVFDGLEDLKAFCAVSIAVKWVKNQVEKLKKAAIEISRGEFSLALLDLAQPFLSAAAMITAGAMTLQGKMRISETVYVFLYMEMFSIAAGVFSGYFSYLTWVSERAEKFLREYWE